MPNYWKICGVPPGFAFNCIENKRFSTRYYGRQMGQGQGQKNRGVCPPLFFCPCPAFPTTRLAFVVAFSLLPVAPIAHALVLERLLKCAQAALNLVALL
jgi:hypothetical protein